MSKRVETCRFCGEKHPVNGRGLCSECNVEYAETDADLDALIESRRATMPDALQPRRRSTPGIRIFPDPRRRQGK